MSVKKYFTFKGRINRKKYLYYQLIGGTASAILSHYNPSNSILSFISVFIVLIISFLLISKSVQRLHDTNTPGVVILVPIILGIAWIFINIVILPMIIFGFYCHLSIKKGTYGPNKYGNAPLNHTTDNVTLLNEI